MESVSSLIRIRNWDKVHQAPPHQIAQCLSRRAGGHLQNCSRRIAIEVFGKYRQPSPMLLTEGREQLIAEAEGAFHQFQQLHLILEASLILRNAEVLSLRQNAGSISQSQRKAATGLCQPLRPAFDARGYFDEKLAGFAQGQNVQVLFSQTRQSEFYPRCDQDAASFRRQQRLHLLAAGGIVQQQQDAFAVQEGMIQSPQFIFALWQAVGGMVGPDDMRHSFRGRQRRQIRLVARASHINEYLAVGKMALNALCDHQGQGGLAHASHAAQAGDGGTFLEVGEDVADLLLAAFEVSRGWRYLVGYG